MMNAPPPSSYAGAIPTIAYHGGQQVHTQHNGSSSLHSHINAGTGNPPSVNRLDVVGDRPPQQQQHQQPQPQQQPYQQQPPQQRQQHQNQPQHQQHQQQQQYRAPSAQVGQPGIISSSKMGGTTAPEYQGNQSSTPTHTATAQPGATYHNHKQQVQQQGWSGASSGTSFGTTGVAAAVAAPAPQPQPQAPATALQQAAATATAASQALTAAAQVAAAAAVTARELMMVADPVACSVDGCGANALSHGGLCFYHADLMRECAVPGCVSMAAAEGRGRCSKCSNHTLDRGPKAAGKGGKKAAKKRTVAKAATKKGGVSAGDDGGAGAGKSVGKNRSGQCLEHGAPAGVPRPSGRKESAADADGDGDGSDGGDRTFTDAAAAAGLAPYPDDEPSVAGGRRGRSSSNRHGTGRGMGGRKRWTCNWDGCVKYARSGARGLCASHARHADAEDGGIHPMQRFGMEEEDEEEEEEDEEEGSGSIGGGRSRRPRSTRAKKTTSYDDWVDGADLEGGRRGGREEGGEGEAGGERQGHSGDGVDRGGGVEAMEQEEGRADADAAMNATHMSE